MRFGVQMYGLNPLFLQDKTGFLKRVKEAGFRYLEPRLMLSPIEGLESRVWTKQQLKEYVPLLKEYGLSIHSVHVVTDDILADCKAFISLAGLYGIRQIVIPCPKEINPAVALDLTKAGDAFANHGIELLLHNGKDDSGFGWLLMATGENVGAQVDLGWLIYSGIDPEAFLWKHYKKIKSLHYKDFDESGNEVAVGTGTLDMIGSFQFARAREIIQILDQNCSTDFLLDMENAGRRLQDLTACRDHTHSELCILDTETGEVKSLKIFDKIIEAPNWMQTDEDSLIFNSNGMLYRYAISSGTETMISTGHCRNCNNDHVLSPDNAQIAVSHSDESWMSKIYILPITGGEPRLITKNEPSFLHGWSADGTELCYCAFRDHGNGYEVDVYAISSEGGEEWQLTKNAGFNDGPEYAPNGEIWFNSTRTGLMQCWKMNRDGSNQTQMTFSKRNNWFPHVSPDGKRVVYLSYSEEGLDAKEHLPNMNVQLRLMDYDGSNDRLLLEFFGGQGSINVNSWHADGKKLAFVRYTLQHP